MRKHRLIAVLATAGATASLTLTAAPAVADSAPTPAPFNGTVSLTVPNVTLTDGCKDVPYQFQISSSPYMDSWDADITYAGPSDWPAEDYLYADPGGSFSGTLSICAGIDEPGSYVASADVEVYDADYNETDVRVTDRFTIKKARTSLRAWRSGGRFVAEFHENGRARSGTSVELQKWSRHHWRYVNEKNTGLSGRVSFSMAKKYGTPYRARFTGDDGRYSSTSRTVKVPKASSHLKAHRAKASRKAWKVKVALRGPLKKHERVKLQRRHGGKWHNTGKSCVTRANGKCSIRFKQKSRKLNHAWYRASFPSTSTKAHAHSSRFHLRKR